MSQSPAAPIDRLLRGVATNHVETTRDAWRDLLGDTAASIPAVKAKLDSPAWKTNPRGPLARYLGTLLCLLDELDPNEFRQQINRLLASKLHPLHRKTAEILSRRSTEKPATHIGPGIPVFVAADICNPRVVVGNLERWSRTANLALDGVTRIDVIARHPQLDYLGLYNLFFSEIILTWPADHPRGLRLWWWRVNAEFTFYHEAGHHACGHVEGGSVADQEDEANAYARSMIRNSYPILTGVVRVLLAPLKPLPQKRNARRERPKTQRHPL